MPGKTIPLPVVKRIALIAHDDRKADLLDWAQYNKGTLSQYVLFGTGTTGTMLKNELGLDVHAYMSGPLGGDQQIGAQIAEGGIDFLIFFWDPLQLHPHDPDVRALLRVATLQNIPIATNRATADFLISSPLMGVVYERKVYDWSERLQRERILEAVHLPKGDQ